MDGMCRSIYIWRRIHLLYAHIHYALPLLCHIILLHMAYDYNICRVGDKEGWHDLSFAGKDLQLKASVAGLFPQKRR